MAFVASCSFRIWGFVVAPQIRPTPILIRDKPTVLLLQRDELFVKIVVEVLYRSRFLMARIGNRDIRLDVAE